MIRAKIDVKKINKDLLFVGQKGTYLDVAFMDNRDGTDQYGNDGFIVQDVSKEAREAGEKGPIIGNWRHVGQKPAPAQRQQPPQSQGRRVAQPPARPPADPDLDAPEDDIPFRAMLPALARLLGRFFPSHAKA